MDSKPLPTKPKTLWRLTVRLPAALYEELEAVRRHEPRESFIKRAIVAQIEAEK